MLSFWCNTCLSWSEGTRWCEDSFQLLCGCGWVSVPFAVTSETLKNNAIILFCGTISDLEEEYCSLAAGKPHLNKALLADLLAHRFSLSVVWQRGWRNISWYSVVMYDHVCLLQHKGTDRFFFLLFNLLTLPRDTNYRSTDDICETLK